VRHVEIHLNLAPSAASIHSGSWHGQNEVARGHLLLYGRFAEGSETFDVCDSLSI